MRGDIIRVQRLLRASEAAKMASKAVGKALVSEPAVRASGPAEEALDPARKASD